MCGKNSLNSPYSCAASVLFGASTSVGLLHRLDDVGDRERLARSGHAEQRLMRQSGLEAVDQAAQRLRLIAGGLERGNELKSIGHAVLQVKCGIITCGEVSPCLIRAPAVGAGSRTRVSSSRAASVMAAVGEASASSGGTKASGLDDAEGEGDHGRHNAPHRNTLTPETDSSRENTRLPPYQIPPDSSAVEQVTVNHWVGGSIPSRGAITAKASQRCGPFSFHLI